MIKKICLLLLIVSTSLSAQQDNTYDDFYKNRWEVPYNWANKDTITLALSHEREPKALDFGEFISFKENKKVTYERIMSCPVGATFTNIENFLIFENHAYVYYKTKSWNEGRDKWKKKHKKYRILNYDGNTMTLRKI